MIKNLNASRGNIRFRSSEDAKDQNSLNNALQSRLNNKGKLTRAAVLVPIIIRDNGLHILLTKRNENLKNHAGQISFPGGRVDDTDRDAQHTALRETQEEIGLKPRLIKVIGELDQYVVGTGYLVNPFVGVIKPPFKLIRQEDEVSEIFEVPLDFLINPANFTRYARMFNGETHYHHAITWGNYFIWGATAGMLRNLSRRLLY